MTTMNAALTGGGAGLVGAVGILIIITALRRRRPTLMARLEPYVHRQPTTSGLLTAPAGLASDGRTVVGLLMASTAGTLNLGRLLDSLGSSADSVRRRLTRSGSPLSLDQFRLQQVLWRNDSHGSRPSCPTWSSSSLWPSEPVKGRWPPSNVLSSLDKEILSTSWTRP